MNLFVVSILVNAVLGIWALLSGDFGKIQGKVLGTSFLVSAAMLSILANSPAIRRRALWPAPLTGAVAGASGFALFIAMVWTETDDGRWFKLAGSFLVVAAGATLASSLALIATADGLRWLWLWPVENALITVLGITVLVGLWAEPDVEWYARLVGIESVLVAAMMLLIPVLARFTSPRQEIRDDGTPSGPATIRFCPSCGQPVTHAPLGTGEPAVCDACGLLFEVKTSPQTAVQPKTVLHSRAGTARERRSTASECRQGS